MNSLIRMAAAIMLWLVLPENVAAQSAPIVRSGEHETFSRLVFRPPGRGAWTLDEGTNDRVRITFDDGLPSLDLSRVFDLIPRDRLTDIRQIDGSLDLSLACDCPLEVVRLSSGHVVIDIQDPGEGSERPPIVLALPRILPERPILFRPLLDPDAQERRRLDRDVAMQSEEDDPRRHISIRKISVDPRVAEDLNAPSNGGCGFEDIAQSHLLADPRNALASLGAARLSATDAAGEFLPDGAEALAHLYLDLGWGEEAIQILRSLSRTDSDRLTLARVLDSDSHADAPHPDPKCGPASAVVAILSGLDSAAVRRLDKRQLAGFVTDLPRAHAAVIRPRLRRALEVADAEDALAFLAIPEPMPVEPSDLAGTDDEALRAIIGSLRDIDEGAEHQAEKLLVNALAFRQSVPAGVDRDALDRNLAPALAKRGYVIEAMQVAEDGAITANDILSTVLNSLSPGQAAEAAMRLRPNIDMALPSAVRAAELFDSYGLSETARMFSAESRVTGSEAPVPVILSAPDPWISRDFTTVAGSQADEADDPRRALARLLLERRDEGDGSAAAPGDLARAEEELAGATELRARLSALLVAPPS